MYPPLPWFHCWDRADEAHHVQSKTNPDAETRRPGGRRGADPGATDAGAARRIERPRRPADENWERLLRTTADLENFKKRAAREREEAVKYANESLVKKLVTVLDNFDMALAAAGQNQEGTAQSLQSGVAMIHQQLRNVLLESGLEEVDAAASL